MAFISFETSQNMLELLQVGHVRKENVFFGEALGRMLAEDIVARENYPDAPVAAMDGYAMLHSDMGRESLSVLGATPAGTLQVLEVTEGHCIKTFTGALMPKGADTLIPIEYVSASADTITINEPVAKGFAVRPVGESYMKGDILIKSGTKIGFAEIGVLAGLNRAMVPVAQKPRVAILATGSEVLDIGETATSSAQIRSSNSYTLQAMAQSAGAQPVQLGVVGDERAAVMHAFENALDVADIVVSTGGVSVGDYDFVKDIVPKLGAEVIYKGVNIKPGQHIMLAQRGTKYIIALPGFAYSSTVTFILYAIPLIKRFLGDGTPLPIVEATLREPFVKRSRKSEFTACNVVCEEGRYWVDFEGKKSGSSAILTNLLGSSGLMMSAEEDSNLPAGTNVHLLLLERL